MHDSRRGTLVDRMVTGRNKTFAERANRICRCVIPGTPK